MTKQEQAKWIRLAIRGFLAAPDRWGKGWYWNQLVGNPLRYCIKGGAAALSFSGAPFGIEELWHKCGGEFDDIPGLGVANDDAKNVRDMARRVEAVLRKEGL